MTLSGTSRAVIVVVLALAALTAAVATFMLPPDRQLGALVRLVVFHGAYTWVNMGLFALAGVVSLVYLVSHSGLIVAWATALRRLAIIAWIGNTGLGMLAAYLAWGSVNPAEPRLRATFIVLFLSGVVLGIDYFAARDRLSAVVDIGMAAALLWLILGARNYVHPESPVMNSGWEIKGPFFAIVGAVAVVSLGLSALLASRVTAERAEASAEPTSVA
ncbi:MAG: hypothetical protein KGZ40_02940 [Clostridiales bacterium]|nr:hypothetical protein [Clostridiales bacterium]